MHYYASIAICVILCVSIAKEYVVGVAQETKSTEERQQHEEHIGGYLKAQANWGEYEDYNEEDAQDCREDLDMPIIVWWTPFTGVHGLPRHCTMGSCCLTQDRSQLLRSTAKVALFYGTDFNPTDLPLPRRNDIWWGLLHEESPKNRPILNHLPVVQAFNLTGTFKRESDFPLTLQFLPSIDSLTSKKEFVTTKRKSKFLKEYLNSSKRGNVQNGKTKERTHNMENEKQKKDNAYQNEDASKINKEPVTDGSNGDKSFKNIAPIVYIHSDCDSPSERDEYMAELSRYIKIDSLGNCLNTRPLPPPLEDASYFDHKDFRHILARYKFTLTIENYGCDDYITEKFWRPLIVGSVPVYWGSPKIDDWAPNPKSVIKISDFATPKDLADYLHTLLRNDSLYETHLTHKIHGEITNSKLISAIDERQWGLDDLDKGSFIDHFECYVCDQIYYHHPHLTSKTVYTPKIADVSHINCPEPKTVLTNHVNEDSYWLEEYEKSKTEAEVLGDSLKNNKVVGEDEFFTKVFESLRAKDFFKRFPFRHTHDEL